MRRRTLLFGTASLAAASMLQAGFVQGDKAGGFPVDIVVGNDPPDRVLTILREVDAQDVRQIKQRGLGGIDTIVAGIVLAKGLANLIVRLLPIWQCGVVVDARASRILTERNCDLPRGTVLVINPNGTRSTLPQASAPQIQLLVENLVPPK